MNDRTADRPTTRRAVLAVLALAAALSLGGCAAPGTAIEPQPDDFAFLEVTLLG